MTGRIHFTPEALQQLHHLDEWICEKASADVARRFVAAILEHIDGILLLPLSGRSRDDIGPGVRTTTYKKRTVVAYAVDDSGDELLVSIVGVFHGGQNWESALRDE